MMRPTVNEFRRACREEEPRLFRTVSDLLSVAYLTMALGSFALALIMAASA